MFSKPTNNNRQPPPVQPARRPEAVTLNNAPAPAQTPAPTRAPIPQARVASVLGHGLVFEGVVHGDGELMIDGALKGDVHVTRLIVGEQAHIEGKIRCTTVEVRGRVLGNIEAQSVKLFETAFVEGDISHGQLSIDVGAYFQGRCQQLRPDQPAAVQPQASIPQPAQVSAAPSPISYAQMSEHPAPAAAAQVIDFDQNHRN